MISVSGLTVSFGGRDLFKEISFMIQAKDKVGLTGKNGAGKSTLLKILSGMQEPTSGVVSYPSGYRLGYLPQEMVHASGRTILEEARQAFKEALDLDEEINTISEQLTIRTDYESDFYNKLIERLNECGERLQMMGGSGMEGEVERMLIGLGFSRADLERGMDEFSGGWKMRVELAKILLQMPDAVLLDEPTNHLDIESIHWLEQFLATYPGAVILVSHDRAFLDAVTTRTIEITLGKIEDYKASYSRYVELRQERRDNQLAAFRNQQKMIEETEKFIDRFRSKASKAVQVQSRIKQLDKVDRLEIEEEDIAAMHIRFPDAPRSGKVVLRADDVAKNFDEKQILKKVSFTVSSGDKIAFVGKNGEGKTTLSKMILNHLEYTGEIEIGHNVKIGYYAQNQADTLDASETVIGTLEAVARNTTTQQIRNLLGAFLFSGEAVDKRVRVLSGGEKARLAMARLLMEPVNLLILDEPTNHLDMRSKDILKDALKNYNGTLLLVSHDREFLDGLCNKVFEFKNKTVNEYPGTLSEFLESRRLLHLSELQQANPGSSKNKEQKQQIKSSPTPTESQKKTSDRELKQLQTKIRNAEEQIEVLEKQTKEKEVELSNPEIFNNKGLYAEVLALYNTLKTSLDEEVQKWEELVNQAEV